MIIYGTFPVGPKVTHLPNPPISDTDERIPNSEPWGQYLLYNMKSEAFLCWDRNNDGNDGNDVLIWCHVNWIKKKTLVIMTEKNIQEFELRKDNKTDVLTDLGIKIYDFLTSFTGWDKVIFVPLLCREVVDGTVEGLLNKLDFVHGFMI